MIAIYSATFCHGEEVVEKTSARLGYRLVTDDIYELAERESGVAAGKIEKSAVSTPPFWDKFTRHQDRNLAYLGLTLARLLQRDEILLVGPAVHLIPRSVEHILRVCLMAELDYRVALAHRDNECSAEQTEYAILVGDAKNAAWVRSQLGVDPCESKMYDLVVPMHTTSVDQAVATICHHAGEPDHAPGPEYRQEIADFRLAAEVNVALAEKGHFVQVAAQHGHVSIVLDEYVTRLQHYKRKLTALAEQVAGVESVEVTPGTGFLPPSLTTNVEIDTPSRPARLLLVDDERDFVHSLSERLEARNFPSSVVYDGQEALSFLEQEQPEVMILDLRMPGIDGMETLRRVKRDHPEVEVIILTGHGSDREERIAMQLGAFAYLKKPTDIGELTEVMKKAYAKIAQKKLGDASEFC